MQVDFSKIKFDEKGLIPAIVQDAAKGESLREKFLVKFGASNWSAVVPVGAQDASKPA